MKPWVVTAAREGLFAASVVLCAVLVWNEPSAPTLVGLGGAVGGLLVHCAQLIAERGIKPWMRAVVGGFGVVVITVGYGSLLWKGPWWLDGSHLRKENMQPADGLVITGFRTTLVALGAGVLAGLGLYYTHRSHRQTEKLFEHTREKDREQAELTREGQVTERYVEAIKLLSSENLTQQRGGIYALERIMSDSRKDHATVVEVLAAFVRQHTQGLGTQEHERVNKPQEHVQTALTVLGRRAEHEDVVDLRFHNLRGAYLKGANLIRAELSSADLQEATLNNARFERAAMKGANFTLAQMRHVAADEADLRGAKLVQADLSRSYLVRANLREADLSAAYLNGATLWRADLRGAMLRGAQMLDARLEQADLRGADLRMAEDINVKELCKAHITSQTKLPDLLARHPKVQARISECDEAASKAEGASKAQ